MSDHEPSGRVAAFAAVVDLAIEETDRETAYPWQSGFQRSDVEERVRREYGADVSTTTVHRALKDAAALGWVTDERQGWDAGERAEQYEPAATPEIPDGA